MWSYILKRILLMIPTLLGVLTLTFAVIQFVPGGPVEQAVHELRRGEQGASFGMRQHTGVDAQQVAQLPLNGRQFTQLTLLTPGAAAQSTGQQNFFEVKSDYGAISPAVRTACRRRTSVRLMPGGANASSISAAQVA